MDRLAADTAIPELLRRLGRWLFALAPSDRAHLVRVVAAAASRPMDPAPRISVC